MSARTATRIGGWAFVLTGAGHLTLSTLLPSTGDLATVERQMAQALFPMPPSHSVADLMHGFSIAMSLLLIAWGVSVLLLTRRGRTPDPAQVGLSLALSLALLVTAVLLLPAPPIVLMTVASVAFAVALRTSVQEAPSCSDGVVAHRSSAPRD
jgi:membrane glycosyltransferase